MSENMIPETHPHDDELAEFTDKLLAGELGEDSRYEFSDDQELRELQEMSVSMTEAFGAVQPDPSMIKRGKKKLSSEWQKMGLSPENVPFWKRWLTGLTAAGRRGQQTRAIALIVALIPLLVAVGVYTNGFQNLNEVITGTVGRSDGYPGDPDEPNPTGALDWLGAHELVSFSYGATNEVQGNNDSWGAVISDDGRYVAFQSRSDNLVDDDFNGVTDIFLYVRNDDRYEMTRVTVSHDGSPVDGDSQNAAISADGRVIAFESAATNLVADDTNGWRDIFVYELETQLLERVSLKTDGTEAFGGNSSRPSLSGDGTLVVFVSAADDLDGGLNGIKDIFLHNRVTGETKRITVGFDGQDANENSNNPAISDDGNWIVFESAASNLVVNDSNASSDIFLYNVASGEMRRISNGLNGMESNDYSYSPAISSNGRYIAFHSGASNLVATDSNNETDIFLYDAEFNTIERITVGVDGVEANRSSGYASISPTGQYIAFSSFASNLVVADDNPQQSLYMSIYVYDRAKSEMQFITKPANNPQPNGSSLNPDITNNGRYIVFDSTDTDLIPDDNNARSDIFLFERVAIDIMPNTGASGSYFSLNGDSFPPDSNVDIIVNGQTLATLTNDRTGDFTATLTTDNADPGKYQITAQTGATQKSVMLNLDQDGVVLGMDSVRMDVTMIDIPAGLALDNIIYLPIINR